MRIFNKFNSERPCPICGTRDDKQTVLIGISGTEDGMNIAALQVHGDCLLERSRFDNGLIFVLADK